MSVIEIQHRAPGPRLLSELVKLAWPITVSTLSYTVMTVVDTAFVGRLGPSALAGVGLGGIAVWTVICFGFGLLRAVKVLVAQSVGAGSRDQVLPFLGAGVLAAFALSVLAIGVGLPIAHYLPRFSASHEAGQLAHTYMSIRLLGTPVVLWCCAIREARYGVGDSRSPMYAALFSNAVHIPLNYLLIFALGWGVSGAAYATIFVQALELGWMLLVQAREGGLGLRTTRLTHVLDVFKLGVPTGTDFLLSVVAFSALVLMVAHMSDADLAAHQVALQVIHFAFMPIVSIGEAASVLAGQSVGANEDRRVLAIARTALGLGATYAGLCGLVFWLGAVPLLGLFTTDTEVQRIGVQLLWVGAGFQLFDAANIVARSVLRGTGDVRIPALISVCSSWTFVPALTWLWGMHQGLGAVGGWLALTVDICVGAGVLSWRLYRGHWLPAARSSRERLARGTVTPAILPAE